MQNKLRIGSYQGPIVLNSFDQNLCKAREVLNQTKDMGLDFLCFPETFLSGYSHQAITESAVPLNDPRLVDFIQQSINFDTVILIGLSEQADGKIFNTQIVVYQGSLLGKYHKTILTEDDKQVFSTDLDLPVFMQRVSNSAW